MGVFIDLSGLTFGNLRVTGEAGRDRRGRGLWKCSCSCGTIKVVASYFLRCGDTVSCGCLRAKKIGALNRSHGMADTPIYNLWRAMHMRCRLPNSTAFKWYGGRGISVCRRWLKFENFFTDMGHRPHGRSLDRINNDGNYEPGNCRWATPKEQVTNRRTRTGGGRRTQK